MSSSLVRPCEYLLVASRSKPRGEEAVEPPPARVYLVAITLGLHGLRAGRENLHGDLVRQGAPRVARQIEGIVLDGDLGVVRPREELRVAELQLELRGLERPVAGREHRRRDAHVEVQALGETRDPHVCLGPRNLVVASVEIERFDGELGTRLVPVPDLRARSPEGDQVVHGVILLPVIVPGRPAAWCGRVARPRGAYRGCLRGWRGPHRRSLRRRALSRARGGGRPP